MNAIRDAGIGTTLPAAARATATANDAAETIAALRAGLESEGSANPGARLAALEHARRAAAAAQEHLGVAYAGRELPLDDAERRALDCAVSFWTWLGESHGALVDAHAEAAPAFAAAATRGALLCLGTAMRELVRAYHGVPGSLWATINRRYRLAEDRGMTSLAVADAQGGDPPDCAGAYHRVLLEQAANLHATTPGQMAAGFALCARFGGLVRLGTAQAPNAARSPHSVDLSSAAGPVLTRKAIASAALRHIDVERVAERLRTLASDVREGRPAPEIADFRGVPRAALEKLLTHLYVQWCSAGSSRLEERKPTGQRAQVATNLHAVHFQISGRGFRQPGSRYTREEEHDIATFGHVTGRTESRLLTSRSSALEPWEIVNRAQSGLLGLCRKPDLHTRLSPGGLVAMRVSSTEPPMLGVIARLRAEPDGGLAIGVRLFSGEIRSAAVRESGLPQEKFTRALVIEGDPARGQAPTLILPRSLYRPKALVDLHVARTETVRLLELLESGGDFARCAYEPK